MEIVLASRNKHKIGELEALLGKFIPDIKILSLDDIGFEGDIVEDGSTFSENANIKASAVARLGYIGMGDDSGLSVRALGGEPGIYSARYAGEHGNDKANNELLLKNLADKSDRYAEFTCTIALAFPDGREPIEVVGRTGGVILEAPAGEAGFGYDPLFFYEPFGKTFAELTAEEKNSISHRGKAIEALAEKIKELN